MGTRTSRVDAAPRSVLLAGAGVVFLVVISAFAYLLLDSQSRARKESEKRFQTRAVVSAAMTESLFGASAAQQQEQAAKEFGGRSVDKGALARLVKRSRLQYGLILGSKGGLLQASPGAPQSRRAAAGSMSRHIREALDGRTYLSDVLQAPTSDSKVIEWAVPFKTSFGERVEVSGLNASLLSDFIGRYLARGRESAKMEGRLVDGRGRVIADAGGRKDHLLNDLSAEARETQGTYGHGESERYFASAPVGGSSWRVIVSEPTDILYPLFAMERKWVLWAMFAAFALAAVTCLVLSRRLLRNSAQLTRANLRLEKRQRELRGANEGLESQTRLAREASRAKSEFLANMSHELRTPLNAIIGFSELMMSGTASETEAERTEYLGYVIASGRHLEQLVNDILDLSKVEAGKMEFHPDTVDLSALIGDVTSTMRVLADRKRVELVTEVAPELQSVVVDPAKLKQVLYNYLSNALKFTPERGRITIRVDPEGSDYFRLGVKDTGVGVAPEDQHKLFREFEQLDQTLSKEHPGTGLGLALVKRIVEAQGGKVGVRSTLRKGSIFYAVLPRAPRQAQHAAGDPQALPAEQALTPLLAESNGGAAVLVVEDDPNDQALLQQILSPAGYAVEIARTGAEAVAKSRERYFDAVVLDLILPDASGFDVLRTIREEGRNPTARTIVLTVVKEKGLARAYSVNDWLVKPVDSDQLLAALERAGIRPEGGTVLVVDDDPSSLKLAEATIKQLGCRVVCASGGEEGLEAAGEHGPLAAIVLDLLMPGIDGFQFLERLRSTADGAQIPVIVWTSQDLSTREQAVLLQTAQGLVGKSQRGAQLADELKPFLASMSGHPAGDEPNGSEMAEKATA